MLAERDRLVFRHHRRGLRQRRADRRWIPTTPATPPASTASSASRGRASRRRLATFAVGGHAIVDATVIEDVPLAIEQHGLGSDLRAGAADQLVGGVEQDGEGEGMLGGVRRGPFRGDVGIGMDAEESHAPLAVKLRQPSHLRREAVGDRAFDPQHEQHDRVVVPPVRQGVERRRRPSARIGRPSAAGPDRPARGVAGRGAPPGR